jgi:hypothetical protein
VEAKAPWLSLGRWGIFGDESTSMTVVCMCDEGMGMRKDNMKRPGLGRPQWPGPGILPADSGSLYWV